MLLLLHLCLLQLHHSQQSQYTTIEYGEQRSINGGRRNSRKSESGAVPLPLALLQLCASGHLIAHVQCRQSSSSPQCASTTSTTSSLSASDDSRAEPSTPD